MYPKLSGMTGTAMTEAPEFFDIYKMNVVAIPTNVAVMRVDDDDEFYKTMAEKFEAITQEIKAKQEIGQPVLVGTISIEKSEMLSEFLEKGGIQHSVLNARFHEQEAHIVAQAGRMGMVTVSTNMAGRGTDIQLGGNIDFRIQDELSDLEEGPERHKAIARIREEVAAEKAKVLEAGGLYVLGTERHESRRIDNQLRGPLRAGRAIRVCRNSILSLTTTCCASSAANLILANDEQEPRGRRGDRVSLDQQSDRNGAEEGRSAELRHPQASRRIRRRDERPAQGHLRAARGHYGRRKRQRGHHRHARGDRASIVAVNCPGGNLPRAVERRRS
jgi:hypothetical protein